MQADAKAAGKTTHKDYRRKTAEPAKTSGGKEKCWLKQPATRNQQHQWAAKRKIARMPKRETW